MAEPYSLTLVQMMEGIARKKLSPLELMESILKRIDTVEPRVLAWVTLDRESVLQEARRQEKEIFRGKKRGPLHGIPVGIKDIFYTAGMKTASGSRVFEDFIPEFDSTAVELLKKAGAIILGKTATTEFAHAEPAPTRNPWNPDHTPGGSSSGSAAAVATGMCPAALGSQTGGSVLRPASYCGVVGLKPTYGRISKHGVFPFSWSFDHVGFFTRSAADAAILLSVLAGYDPRDPSAGRETASDYIRPGRIGRRPPRIGFVRSFYEENTDEQVWSHTGEILKRLKKAGAKILDVEMPPSFAAVQDSHRIIMRAEGAAVHQDLFARHGEKYRPKTREMIQIGSLIPAVEYLRAQRIKRQFRRDMDRMIRGYDCLLTPTTSSPAPRGLSSTGNAWFQVPWSFSGLPTITLPSGLSGEGLPLGVQLVGLACLEGKLLSVARWCEKVLRFSPNVLF